MSLPCMLMHVCAVRLCAHMQCDTICTSRHLTASGSSGLSRSTLHQAVLGGNSDFVAWVLSLAPDMCHHTDTNDMTPFALACAVGNLKAALLVAGDTVAAAVTSSRSGVGRVLRGRWVVGPGPMTLTRSAGGHTSLTLAVSVYSFLSRTTLSMRQL